MQLSSEDDLKYLFTEPNDVVKQDSAMAVDPTNGHCGGSGVGVDADHDNLSLLLGRSISIHNQAPQTCSSLEQSAKHQAPKACPNVLPRRLPEGKHSKDKILDPETIKSMGRSKRMVSTQPVSKKAQCHTLEELLS
jgi:hypothetical protein